MGRGRAKAKQTKVARQLKYSTSGTDLDRLRAELAAQQPQQEADEYESESDEYEDPYAELYDDEDDEDDDESVAP